MLAVARQILDFEELMFSGCRRLELDEAGRIRIPESLNELYRLSSKVVVIWSVDHIELVSAKDWRLLKSAGFTDVAAMLELADTQGVLTRDRTDRLRRKIERLGGRGSSPRARVRIELPVGCRTVTTREVPHDR